jgi:ATP-dependent DNA helicase DinG
MVDADFAASALQAFDQVVVASGDFRDRPGQRLMAGQVARTFSEATLGKMEDETAEPVRSIAVIQAGTGVGKSLAYCAPAIALALARNTRVLISTATVALQEQLVNKDLPLLATQMPQPFRFALAKGRGRYVCKLKLARHGRYRRGRG